MVVATHSLACHAYVRFRGGMQTMAIRTGRLAIRGPSSPDLGQERPADRLRPSVVMDLGIRDDGQAGTAGAHTPVSTSPRRQ